jgi:2-dehydropantoate 2-reductase
MKGTQKHVGIIGMGPVGMILAVKLQLSGCKVSICGINKVKLNQIKNEGIRLEGVFKANCHFENIFSSLDEMVDADLKLDYLFFTLKSYQITSVARKAQKLSSDNLTVISAQNGIDVEELLVPFFGASRILRMVINFAGNISALNVVRVSFWVPPNYVGSIDGERSKESEELAGLLCEADLKTVSVDSFEIVKRSWEKTILNASLSALCGVGRLTMAEAMDNEDTVELVEQIIHEGVQVADAEMIKFPDNFIRNCMQYLRKGGDHFPSLAGDLINKRQTEIDYLNGKIVEYGKKHYLRTSLNLAFTNMVKAMTNKNISTRVPGVAGSGIRQVFREGAIKDKNEISLYKGGPCFLGVDLGSAYIKFTLIDENRNMVFRYQLETLNKNRLQHKQVKQAIHSEFDIKYSCATGYGRKHFIESDIIKTEVNCAAVGVSNFCSGEKNIIDMGGEDIKIIKCDSHNAVNNFYMNDKCAAGTGAFLTEIAERADIEIKEMSALASSSDFNSELNSFCTVFAKTEIMKWIYEGVPVEDVARGIYLSTVGKVAKMRIDPGIPTIMIGGVIAHHPYLKHLLEEKLEREIQLLENSQHIVSLGASLIAQRVWLQENNLINTAEYATK